MCSWKTKFMSKKQHFYISELNRSIKISHKNKLFILAFSENECQTIRRTLCKVDVNIFLIRSVTLTLTSDNYPTVRSWQWFQWGRNGATRQRWLEVRAAVGGFFGCGRQSRCCADWGQAESVLRLPICSTSLLPGAGLGAADARRVPGAVRELRRGLAEEVRPAEASSCSRGSGFGGGVLLWGVGWQRLHAAHRSAAWTAAQGVTYAGTRKQANRALIKKPAAILQFNTPLLI